jgi:UDP-N-acetylmuramate dehydrogenase
MSVTPDIPLTTLIEGFGANLEIGKSMALLTSFRTGGPARYFLAAASIDEVIRALASARRLGIPAFVMGGGSNLLVSDDGFDGLVIKIDIRGMEKISDTDIEAGAGEDLKALVEFATANALTGMEFAAGIWGSVGGAICGNAGAYGSDTGSVITEVTLVDPEGKVTRVPREKCAFAYRHSRMRDSREIIVSARFHLEPGDRETIRKQVDEILADRNQKHPINGLSAGCFFKNILDPKEPHGKLPAGRLLDQSGAKNMQVGGAKVFDRHANIIVNTGSATSKDIRRLADILKQRVKERFGIELQEEVQQLGEI